MNPAYSELPVQGFRGVAIFARSRPWWSLIAGVAWCKTVALAAGQSIDEMDDMTDEEAYEAVAHVLPGGIKVSVLAGCQRCTHLKLLGLAVMLCCVKLQRCFLWLRLHMC